MRNGHGGSPRLAQRRSTRREPPRRHVRRARLDPCRRRTHVLYSSTQGASMTSNPLLAFSGLPRFDALEAEHVGPAIATLAEQAAAAGAAAAAVGHHTRA